MMDDYNPVEHRTPEELKLYVYPVIIFTHEKLVS